MAGVAAGGPAAGSRLETELGYGLPVGSRLDRDAAGRHWGLRDGGA